MLNEKLKKMKSEDKKTVSLLLGFVIVLSCLFVVFEWSSEKVVVRTIDFDGFTEEMVFIPQTQPERPPAPLPPPPNAAEIIEPLTVANLTPVDNTVETEMLNLPSTDPNDDLVFTSLSQLRIVDTLAIVDFLPYEDMPKFNGNLMEFLARNIRYPVVDQNAGISGRVIVQFVVDVDGSITDIQIVRGVSPTIDREARRVVELMQNWTPGHQRGTPVRVRYTLPITFRLQ